MKKFDIEYVKDYCNKKGLKCISDTYIDMKSNLQFICPSCGEVYERNFNNIKYRKNILCYNCSRKKGGRKQAFTYKEVKNYIEIKSDSGCKLLSKEYLNTDSKILIQCRCGNEFLTTFYKFKDRDKQQCNDCGLIISKYKNATPISSIIKMVEKENYLFIENELSGGDQKIHIQCPKGHSSYWVNVSKFKSGQRCPYCYRSLGEDFVSQELDKLNIKYKQEYTFDDLKGVGGGSLRYDFAIFNKKELSYLIEYDGKQHFEVAFGDEELLKRTQQHDAIKDQYAKNNKIPLYRIPYTQYDEIPMIISKIIKQQV